jgi:hypothetical protein
LLGAWQPTGIRVNEHLSIKSAGLSQKCSFYTEITAFQNSFGQAVSGARVLNCKGHPHELHLSLSGSKLAHLAYCIPSFMQLFYVVVGYICFHSKLVTPLAICIASSNLFIVIGLC